MSNLDDHNADQAEITALCESGECDHPECKAGDLGMMCPGCGHVGSFMVVATVWGMNTIEGHDQDHPDLPDHDSAWDQYAGCICPACAKTGVVEDFMV